MSYDSLIGLYFPKDITTIIVSFLGLEDYVRAEDYKWLVEHMSEYDHLNCYEIACKEKKFHIGKLMRQFVLGRAKSKYSMDYSKLLTIAVMSNDLKMVKHMFTEDSFYHRDDLFIDLKYPFEPIVLANHWDMIRLLLDLEIYDAEFVLDSAISMNSLKLAKIAVEEYNITKTGDNYYYVLNSVSDELCKFLIDNCKTEYVKDQLKKQLEKPRKNTW